MVAAVHRKMRRRAHMLPYEDDCNVEERHEMVRGGVHWEDAIEKLRRGSSSHSSHLKLDLELRTSDSMTLLAAVSAS